MMGGEHAATSMYTLWLLSSTDFKPLFSLYTSPHTSVFLTSFMSIVFFSLINFDLYDHYDDCCVPLRIDNSGRSVIYTFDHNSQTMLVTIVCDIPSYR